MCSCPPVMGGVTVKHALTSTSSPPNDILSIPWSPVVLPLQTPLGSLLEGFPTDSCITDEDSVAVAVGQFHNLGTCPFRFVNTRTGFNRNSSNEKGRSKLCFSDNRSDLPCSARCWGAGRSGNQVPISYRETRRPHSSRTKVRTRISY